MKTPDLDTITFTNIWEVFKNGNSLQSKRRKNLR
jgi:hypothetical protein